MKLLLSGKVSSSSENMADDFDVVEALLEAPYRRDVSTHWPRGAVGSLPNISLQGETRVALKMIIDDV